jgi:hypothetical protein
VTPLPPRIRISGRYRSGSKYEHALGIVSQLIRSPDCYNELRRHLLFPEQDRPDFVALRATTDVFPHLHSYPAGRRLSLTSAVPSANRGRCCPRWFILRCGWSLGSRQELPFEKPVQAGKPVIASEEQNGREAPNRVTPYRGVAESVGVLWGRVSEVIQTRCEEIRVSCGSGNQCGGKPEQH